MSFIDNIRKGWNAFLGRDPTIAYKVGTEYYGSRPDRIHFSYANRNTIATAIYNRIALDAAAIDIHHVYLDEQGRFDHYADSALENCLTLEANADQTGRSFMQDVVESMLDEGVVAVVPIDTSENPEVTDSYDIYTMRTGKIVSWYPNHVRVKVYNERTGRKEERIFPKKMVAIIENPLYAVINDNCSMMQQLIHTLALLNSVNEQQTSEKLNLIVQLPYIARTAVRKEQASARRKDIEDQLANSKYGVAYLDATEKIIQLNRPLDNQLMSQVEYLTNMVYSQLGITTEILNGTADEKVMLNYHNRTIEPIVAAIADEFKRKFLTKKARTIGQSIEYFRDPFRLVPVNDLAELADKFTRNEIMTSNEIRQIVGMQPSSDPSADELRNKNLNQSAEEIQGGVAGQMETDSAIKRLTQEGENQNG